MGPGKIENIWALKENHSIRQRGREGRRKGERKGGETETERETKRQRTYVSITIFWVMYKKGGGGACVSDSANSLFL